MRFPRSVATLAGDPLATMLERKLRVRVRSELGRGLGVTGRANLRPDVIGSVNRRLIQMRGG
jgi:hypothetical protein